LLRHHFVLPGKDWRFTSSPSGLYFIGLIRINLLLHNFMQSLICSITHTCFSRLQKKLINSFEVNSFFYSQICIHIFNKKKQISPLIFISIIIYSANEKQAWLFYFDKLLYFNQSEPFVIKTDQKLTNKKCKSLIVLFWLF